ncbi:MAG: STAS domain-containing protein [Leptospiraceae bacterium]|nr:STAS domain-containing protein [Leptospiraceae bacterium]
MKLDSHSDIRILKFQGAILRKDSEVMDQDLIQSNAFYGKKVILDFTKVHHICSSALGVLVTLKRKLKSQDGDVCIVISDEDIRQVFEITMLDKVFQIFESVPDAQAKF